MVHVPGSGHTDMGWEVFSDGFRDTLLRVHHDGPPAIHVTENGAAYGDVRRHDGSVLDPERQEFLRDHIDAVGQAIDAGAPAARRLSANRSSGSSQPGTRFARLAMRRRPAARSPARSCAIARLSTVGSDVSPHATARRSATRASAGRSCANRAIPPAANQAGSSPAPLIRASSDSAPAEIAGMEPRERRLDGHAGRSSTASRPATGASASWRNTSGVTRRMRNPASAAMLVTYSRRWT